MTYLRRNKLGRNNLISCITPSDDNEPSERVQRQFAECGQLGNVKITRLPAERNPERNPFVHTRQIEDPYTGETVPMMTFCRHNYQQECGHNEQQRVRFHDASTSVVGQRGSDLTDVCSCCNSVGCARSSGLINVQLHRNIHDHHRPQQSPDNRSSGRYGTVNRTFHVRNGIQAPPPSPSWTSRSTNEHPRTSTWVLPAASNTQTQSSFNTAVNGLSNAESLEWDNYEPPIGVSYNRASSGRNPHGIVLSTLQYWV